MEYSAEEVKRISEYSDKIQTIDDYMEAIRRTLGQYLSYTGNKGWLNAGRELIQNMLDEMNDPDSICTEGIVEFDETTQRFTVSDNGRGIPFKDIQRVYASPHTSKNYEKGKGNYSSGSHGIGAKVTNAVSKEFIVISYILGHYRRVVFNNGIPKDIKDGDAKGKQGTTVSAIPHSCMENPDLKVEDVLNLLESVIPLYRTGTKVIFIGERLNHEKVTKVLVNEDGLLTYLIRQTQNPLIPPIIFTGDTGEVKVELAFTYDATDLTGQPTIDSFANYCPTLMGTHVDGFLNSISNYFRSYMNNIYLKESDSDKKKRKKEIRCCNNDIKTGLKAVIHGLCLYPTFMGQAKEGISNIEIRQYLENMIPTWLDQWQKTNPVDFAKLCKFFKQVAELRINSDKAKEKFVEKYKKNRLTNFPEKFLPPNNLKSNQLELIITEGDSAFGSFKNSRNAETQGIFPIRGKMINAFTNSNKKVMENEEVQALLMLMDEINWARIIIGADADIDGYHIRTLFMKIVLKKRPELILDGKIFIAIPPLYGLPLKNGKMRYFKDKLEYISYVEEEFVKKTEVLFKTGVKVSKGDLVSILYHNADYAKEMDKISYVTDATFLEYTLRNRHKSPEELHKTLLSRYRFVEDVRVESNTVVVKALVNQKVQTIFLNDRFYEHCSNILPYIDKNYNEFIVDGVHTGLYGLMKAFDKFSPPIIRYKGLGEMNEDQLAESTLYPSPKRQLMQYTTRDLEADIERIRYLESNKQELLSALSSE